MISGMIRKQDRQDKLVDKWTINKAWTQMLLDQSPQMAVVARTKELLRPIESTSLCQWEIQRPCDLVGTCFFGFDAQVFFVLGPHQLHLLREAQRPSFMRHIKGRNLIASRPCSFFHWSAWSNSQDSPRPWWAHPDFFRRIWSGSESDVPSMCARDLKCSKTDETSEPLLVKIRFMIMPSCKALVVALVKAFETGRSQDTRSPPSGVNERLQWLYIYINLLALSLSLSLSVCPCVRPSLSLSLFSCC